MERYDVLTVREKDGKSYFTKLGAMFPNKSGDGFTIMLDAVPAGIDGQFKLIVKKPLPRDDGGQRPASGGGAPARPAYDDDLDDSVPFISADPSLEHRVR